jgi:hypothetical protein
MSLIHASSGVRTLVVVCAISGFPIDLSNNFATARCCIGRMPRRATPASGIRILTALEARFRNALTRSPAFGAARQRPSAPSGHAFFRPSTEI